MPEETKESKAQKLAAARKKLKEYQKRGDVDVAASGGTPPTGSGSVSSNLSEKSDSELNLTGNGIITSGSETPTGPKEVESTNASTAAPIAMTLETAPPVAPAAVMNSAASYFGDSVATSAPDTFLSSFSNEPQQNLNAIQVLITEKAQLTSELNKCRSMCREKDLELEELRTQFTNTTQRLEELQQRFVEHQQNTEQLRHMNTELQQKLTQAKASDEDQSSHVDELKKQLAVAQTRSNELEQQFKDKCNELEMSQIRIRQLSDEANISKDNRVETLTQTQFMYEQQIRDLQAMVQQLSQDKEQANTQYQNYAQHLNSEVVKLNEKNSELMDESSKFEERERQLIDHISGLEKEIQKNISRQDQLREETKQACSPAPELVNEIEKLKDQINDFGLERHEFQLKIKSQEDRLEKLTAELHQKQNETEEMREHLENVSSEQPDKMKLLATLESDKVAASRALTQNVELKKQLDELELRFVQLTNDKADLMNRLDSEEYANREMRTNYAAMEERLHSIDERFKFKDEEMIRLSHENVELSQKNAIMQQEMDRLKHYEVREYRGDQYDKSQEHGGSNETESTHHQYSESVSRPEEAKENGNEDHPHDHTDGSCGHHHNDESEQHKHAHGETHYHHHQSHSSPMPHIATTEAVEKLQHRFTQLMSQVADLTDEKQRLEHLVLQLQGETETIGEYIALYQTQRRILKQREYEKAAQMKLLQQEREQMSEKIGMLNNLVSSLGVELPQNMRLKEHLNAALAESVSIEPSDGEDSKTTVDDLVARQQQWPQQQAEMSINQKLNSTESQEILTKIQNIITEIKENTKEVPTVTHSVDHFNCCLGKFEVV